MTRCEHECRNNVDGNCVKDMIRIGDNRYFTCIGESKKQENMEEKNNGK